MSQKAATTKAQPPLRSCRNEDWAARDLPPASWEARRSCLHVHLGRLRGTSRAPAPHLAAAQHSRASGGISWKRARIRLPYNTTAPINQQGYEGFLLQSFDALEKSRPEHKRRPTWLPGEPERNSDTSWEMMPEHHPPLTCVLQHCKDFFAQGPR